MKPEEPEPGIPRSSEVEAGPPYVDTSVLAKRYLNESRSDDVDEFLCATAPVSISSLTLVEMRSLLARRRREGSVDPRVESLLWAALEDDVAEGHLLLRPLLDEHAAAAARLIAMLPQVPVRTLDSLHLAIARGSGAALVVTADAVMAAAAVELGLGVVRFDR